MDRKKRIRHYTALIELIQEPENHVDRCVGLCFYIDDMFGYDVYDHSNFKELYPELFAQKPKLANENDYWWPVDDVQHRIEALEKAIDLAKKSIKIKK